MRKVYDDQHDPFWLRKVYDVDDGVKTDPSFVRFLAVDLSSSRAAAGITRIDLSGNSFAVDSAQALARALPIAGGLRSLVIGPRSTELTASASLNLCGQELSASELTIVAAWLFSKACVSVDLSKNLISNTTVEHYTSGKVKHVTCVDADISGIESLSSAKPVKELVLADCFMGPNAIAALAACFSAIGLEKLDISRNSITGGYINSAFDGRDKLAFVGTHESGVTALAMALPSSTITKLNFSCCGLGPKAMHILAATLPNTAIEELDISANVPVGRNGSEEHGGDMSAWSTLCSSLGKSSIKRLIAAGCYLGPESVLMLANAISTTKLDTVTLSDNPVTGGDDCFGDIGEGEDTRGITALVTSLGDSQIKHLALSNCGVSEQAISMLIAILDTPRLSTLDLSQNVDVFHCHDKEELKKAHPEVQIKLESVLFSIYIAK